MVNGKWHTGCAMRGKSNNFHGVYGACVMLHNSRQPLTHTRTDTHSHTHTCMAHTLPLNRGSMQQNLLVRCPICMGNNFVGRSGAIVNRYNVCQSRSNRNLYLFFEF